MAETRIAVIGAGIIGRTHVETLARTPGLALCALADPAPAAATLAAEHGAPYFPDTESLLDAARPDGVIVASPNDTHLPVTRLCLEAGVPVLLEKPPANTVAEAQELADIAARTGVPVLVGHHRRHNPIIRAAHAAVKAGRLGDLVLASVICSHAKDDAYFRTPWRLEPGNGGPLRINLVHEIDILRHLFGEVAAVTAQISHERRGLPVEDTGVVTLRFEAGGLASLAISDTARGPWSWETTSGEGTRFSQHPAQSHFLCGSAAALSLPDLALWSHAPGGDWTGPQRHEILPHAPADPYVAQLTHFVAVIGGASPLIDAADGARNIAVIEAIHAAAASGRLTEVPRIRDGGDSP